MTRADALTARPAALYRKHGRAGVGCAGMPKGLFARALIIIIAPMVILQSVLAYVFMERHWQTVTRRLSAAVTQDIAALIDIAESYPQDRDFETLVAHRRRQAATSTSRCCRPSRCRRPGPSRSSRSSTARLSRELRQQIGRPFWIDTVGRSNLVEIRIQLDRRRDARPHPPLAGLCVELAHLPDVDGGHLAGAARHRGDLPAQPDPARSCGWPRRRRASARAARSTSARAARARCGRPATPSSRCAAASSAPSSSARRCSTASATTCAPSSRASSSRSR